MKSLMLDAEGCEMTRNKRPDLSAIVTRWCVPLSC